MINVQGLYDSLLDASYRGLVFNLIDTRMEVGRRLQRDLFPGRDDVSFQDLGALDGPIRVTGLLSGDDYVQQAQRLRDAFRKPGPATLVLPWLPPAQVVLQEPANISFTQDEFRIARFEASFALYVPLVPPKVDTLQAMLDAAGDLDAQARAWLAATLAPLILPLAVFAYCTGYVARLANVWAALAQGGGGIDTLGPAVAGPIATLFANPGGYGPSWGDSTAAAIAAVPDAIAAASVPTPVAAVGPGGAVVTPVAADPRDAVTLLLAASARIATNASDPAPGPSLTAATWAVILANVINAASDIVYASQQDAITWRDRILASTDLCIAAAAKLAAGDPAGVAPTWRGLVAMRAAFLADINSQIGRLPPVVTITLPATVPAWLVAQFAADGDPARVRASYLDIVARNQIAHAALVPAGPVEVLA